MLVYQQISLLLLAQQDSERPGAGADFEPMASI